MSLHFQTSDHDVLLNLLSSKSETAISRTKSLGEVI